MRAGLSHDGTLYAAPFYGESSMVMYRTDLMEAAGLEMPDAPTWDFIREAAAAMDDRENGINGICLRGKAGWGEGGAFITVTGNSFGARWFDEDWNAQFDQPEWAEALNFFVNLMNDYGPDGYATNGFNENLSLFQQGLCGMWIDATVAASFVTNPDDSDRRRQRRLRAGADTGLGKRSNWLWAWALAIPAGTQQADAALQFIEWATSKDYIELVAENEGWANVPPGARTSLYENPDYSRGAVRADDARLDPAADPNNPTVDPVPYVGIQFVAIPEFAGIATEVSQEFSAAYAGQQTVEEALANAQASDQRSNGSRWLPLGAPSEPPGGGAPVAFGPLPLLFHQRQRFNGPAPEQRRYAHGDPAFPIRRRIMMAPAVSCSWAGCWCPSR
jgi:sorbitol/mannitol transport system substrate-binding protein